LFEIAAHHKNMEGKGLKTPFGTVIMGILILSLLVAQTLVEAKSCCPSTSARNIYNACRFGGGSRPTCASLSGCRIIDGTTCPSGWDKSILEKSGDVINEYCKLGCASSLCDIITTLQKADVGVEVVNEAVKKCNNACSEFCTKGSTIAIVTDA